MIKQRRMRWAFKKRPGEKKKRKMCIKIQSMSEKMEFQTLAERQVFGSVRQNLCPVKLCARNADRCPKETSGKERKGTSQSERTGVWVKFSGTLLNGPLSAWALTRKSVNSFPSGLCDLVMHGPLRLPQAFRLRPWWGVGKKLKKKYCSESVMNITWQHISVVMLWNQIFSISHGTWANCRGRIWHRGTVS